MAVVTRTGGREARQKGVGYDGQRSRGAAGVEGWRGVGRGEGGKSEHTLRPCQVGDALVTFSLACASSRLLPAMGPPRMCDTGERGTRHDGCAQSTQNTRFEFVDQVIESPQHTVNTTVKAKEMSRDLVAHEEEEEAEEEEFINNRIC